MSRKLWIFIIIAMAALFGMIGGMIYVVHAKYEYNDFVRNLTFSFNAATYVNATEVQTDPDSAVVVRTSEESWIVHPDQYKKVLLYLKYNAVYVPFAHVPDSAALRITLCGETEIRVQPAPDGQTALIRLDVSNRHFVMRISYRDLYDTILTHCRKNAVPLES